ncbi:MAG: proton-conducting transporter membrane subunit [Proteobacteria bacterium]|nr:proton-conducting transporter membrane subunit [Pseudomonadota bacterium]
MLTCILILLLAPMIAAVFIASGRRPSERCTALIATFSGLTHLVGTLGVILIWYWQGQHFFSHEFGSIFQTPEYGFPVSVYVDSMSVLWLFMATFLSNIVIKFSRVYLHKDPGYHRFFVCLMFLLFGLSILAVAGSLDTFMAGWEFVGVCSFLLISFYNERNMTVRNAFKVYSIYRFCDAGLLLGAWLTHVLWHEIQSFAILRSPEIQLHLADVGQSNLFAVTCLILLAAAGKSAQFPFTFWLSRAMEGPTPSSAIFYGALSVHAGLFLLFRTSPIWTAFDWGPVMVGSLGFITMITASGIARVQSNIKGQIAYSSAAHVGIMFIELALGWKSLAMLHMFGNSFFRCYQLLVSPSSVALLLRQQGSKSYQLRRQIPGIESILPKKFASSLYVFALNDGFLENLVRRTIWAPMTGLGKLIHRNGRFFILGLLPIALGALALLHNEGAAAWRLAAVATAILTSVGLTFLALSETESSIRAWNAVALSNAFAAASVWAHDSHILREVLVFSTGIVFFWLLGLQALLFLRGGKSVVNLSTYHGLVKVHPGSSFMLFLGVLGVSGFPISPTFVGQDMLLHHAVDNYVWLTILLAVTFSVNGLALMRIYAKVCLGSGIEYSKHTAQT